MIIPKWRQSSSLAQPKDVDDYSSKTTTYLHRNARTIQVKEDPMDDDSPEVTMWVYEEAAMSKAEYNQYETECANDAEHLDQELALADLAETTDEQNLDNMLAITELGGVVEENDTDAALAVTEAYAELAEQISALEARIAVLEGKE